MPKTCKRYPVGVFPSHGPEARFAASALATSFGIDRALDGWPDLKPRGDTKHESFRIL
jgi:hypothetical protein